MKNKIIPFALISIGTYMILTKSNPLFGQTIPSLDKNDPWYQTISKYSAIYHIPKSVIYAVIRIESSGNPRSIEHSGYWSGVGAMQISLPTARSLGFRGTKTQLFQRDNNIHYGTAYLARLKKTFHGDIFKIIMGYHRGPDLQPWDQAYLSKFLRYYYSYAPKLGERAWRYIS